jgi:hypothetical protein
LNPSPEQGKMAVQGGGIMPSSEVFEQIIVEHHEITAISPVRHPISFGYITTGLHGEPINREMSGTFRMGKNSKTGQDVILMTYFGGLGSVPFYLLTYDALHNLFNFFYRSISSPVQILTDLSVSPALKERFSRQFEIISVTMPDIKRVTRESA